MRDDLRDPSDAPETDGAPDANGRPVPAPEGPVSDPPDVPTEAGTPEPPSSPDRLLVREPDPAISAMDRVQAHHEYEDDEHSGVSWRWLAGLVLVVLGIVGVWMWTHRDTGPDNDLLREAVAAYREFRPSEITNDPEVAASWVFENLEGWLIFPPEVEGFDLLGVGAVELADAVFVPAFRYDGLSSATFVVFAYDYILLDEAAETGRLRLAPEVYARLAEPEPVDIRREGDAYVVTWRRRSIVFTAVAPGEELATKISQAVRRQEL